MLTRLFLGTWMSAERGPIVRQGCIIIWSIITCSAALVLLDSLKPVSDIPSLDCWVRFIDGCLLGMRLGYKTAQQHLGLEQPEVSLGLKI